MQDKTESLRQYFYWQYWCMNNYFTKLPCFITIPLWFFKLFQNFGRTSFHKKTFQGSQFGLEVTFARLLSVVFSNSWFLKTGTNFLPWFLILWYCHSCFLIRQWKLSFSSSLTYPNVLCSAKKTWYIARLVHPSWDSFISKFHFGFPKPSSQLFDR